METLNQQGTLASINSPLTAAATQPQPPADPTATDQATQAPPTGSATLAQRFPGFQSAWNQKYSNAASNAMAAGLNPLAASVVGAIHANDPSKPVTPTVQGSPQPAAGTDPNTPSPAQSLTTAQKIQNIAQNGLAGIGDIGAIGQIPKGSGKLGAALVGIGRVQAAGTEREQKQQMVNSELDKNKVMMAEVNSRMQHEQRLIHNLDEDAKTSAMTSGQKQLDIMRSQPAPSRVIGKDLISSEIGAYLQKVQGADAKFDPLKETAVPTGIRTMGTDKNGIPQTQLTYTLVSVPDDVKLDPNDPKQKEELDLLNANAPPDKGKWGVGGIQSFTGTEYNLVRQQANDKIAAGLAADKARLGAGFELNDIKKGKEALSFQNDPTMINAMANASNNGDIIAARNAIMKGPQAAKYPNLDNDLREYMGFDKKTGASVYDKMLEDYQKKVDMGITQISDLQKEVDKVHGEDAAGVAASIGKRIEATTDPYMKAKLVKMQDQATASAKASADYAANLEQRKKTIESSIGSEDIPTLVDMAKQYEMDPKDMASMRKDLRSKIIAELHREDPKWDEKTYRSRWKTAQDFTPEGKGGLAVQSLNTFGGHLGEANELIQGAAKTNAKFLNTPINKLRDVWGSQAISDYKTSLLAVNHEYENFLNNQHAAHEIDKQAMEKLISDDTPPAVAQGIMRQMAKTVAVRAHSLNGAYRTTMNKDVPGLLEDDTQQVLRTFGIDPNSITAQGNSGLIGGGAPKDPQGNVIKPAVPQGMAPDSVYVKTPDGKYAYFDKAKIPAITAAGGLVVQ